MVRGVFITGTSTEIGKTYVGQLIAKKLCEKNIKVIPRKPVESGCLLQGGELIPQDAMALMQAANYQGNIDEVCPYRFEPAISPERAAILAGISVTTQQLKEHCLENSEQGFLLVEGAGGFYSPLASDGLNADLAKALALPVLLVAEDTLGCINQVLLSKEAIEKYGLQLCAVILNTIEEYDDDEMDNVADLQERLDCPVYALTLNADTNQLPDKLIEQLF